MVLPVMIGSRLPIRHDTLFWVGVGIACVGGAAAITLGVVVLSTARRSLSDALQAVAIIATVAGGGAWCAAALMMFSG